MLKLTETMSNETLSFRFTICLLKSHQDLQCRTFRINRLKTEAIINILNKPYNNLWNFWLLYLRLDQHFQIINPHVIFIGFHILRYHCFLIIWHFMNEWIINIKHNFETIETNICRVMFQRSINSEPKWSQAKKN